MPNTLAHIGIQTPLTRLGLQEVPLQWIAVGCIIPDTPWIVQRIFTFIPGMDLLNLRLYTVTQASLAYCLLLSLALAMLTRNSKKIFLILSTNSLLHLLLDASQHKWGNGVNLLVPFSWQPTSFQLFWPEHFLSYLLSLMGLIVFLILWPKSIRMDLLLKRPNRAKTICATACLLFYFVSPPLLLHSAYTANTHYCRTLSDSKTRTGKTLEIDRGKYTATSNTIECYINKYLEIVDPPNIASGIISIQGYFMDEKTIKLTAYHVHKSFRDYASYAGLLLTLLLWIHTVLYQKSINNIHRNSNESH
ncbi:MAG: hypothetical protein U9R57_01620 [Thermodesulfobacteriota bacterium]|nr:hypothetical protein [Thermodesulfobacteriota bacterium]